MRTTLFNPTVWLLAGVFLAGAWALVRGRAPHDALEIVINRATTWPALLLLSFLALAGVGSRAVVGYLAPGAYAEEVLAARAFLQERQVYGGDDRAEFGKWLHDERAPAEPWTLPGLSVCQASAVEQRPQFYTSQAHSPVLLIASVPIVRVVGGRGLFVVVFALSLVAVTSMWWALVCVSGMAAFSRRSALLGIALLAWQPVLAGLRQGDAVLIAAALLTWSWAWTRRRRWARAGIAAGLAAVAAVPAAAAVLALARWPRAFAWACLTAAGAVAAAVAFGGPMLLPDFARNVVAAARTYAGLMPNYALAGRVAGSGALGAMWLAASAATLAPIAWWRARSVDQSFAAFAVLGLVFAPLAWSQHMTLATVPLVVLLGAALESDRAWRLTAWTVVALALSLPDPAIAVVSEAVPALGWPVVPFALVALGAGLAAWQGDAREDRHAAAPS